MSPALIMADEEFHVDTPKKDGGFKKDLKYGWMEPTKPPKPPKPSRSIDAIIAAPTITQARRFARTMNYTMGNVLVVTRWDWRERLEGMTPDDDVPVYVVGTWLNDFKASDGEVWALTECEEYLRQRGFEWIEVENLV